MRGVGPGPGNPIRAAARVSTSALSPWDGSGERIIYGMGRGAPPVSPSTGTDGIKHLNGLARGPPSVHGSLSNVAHCCIAISQSSTSHFAPGCSFPVDTQWVFKCAD